MDIETLDKSISDLTSALGDPTRRAIYVAVRESPEPLSTAHVAGLFHLHPNVARHHLDRLAEDGYLKVSHRRAEGKNGPGAGRPAKCYEATAKEVSVHFAPRRFEMLVDMLIRVLDQVAPENVAQIAEDVGRAYGQELAAEIGGPEQPGYDGAIQAVATAMTGLGFSIDPDVPGQRLLTSHCPFGEAATSHPEVICSLDRGIVAGMFGAMSYACNPVVIPHTDLADDCVTRVPVNIRST
ncbi:MAG TPA: helix-turn-helix domain-containing protein [Acidimicrobiia bacterium]|nr:helix-turn-helix domain-containing protein [Acidimicrobiia bacterium]